MEISRIDKAVEIAPALLTFPNLEWKYGTGVSITTGRGMYKKSSYRNGVMTELGDIEESIWYQLMEGLVQDSGESWLLDALIQWKKEQNLTHQPLSEVRKEALRAHSSRIFDNPHWVDFVSFNWKYRPALVQQARIVIVVNECCNMPGEVTQEQIDSAYDGTIHCPHCGRWSRFALVEDNQSGVENA